MKNRTVRFSAGRVATLVAAAIMPLAAQAQSAQNDWKMEGSINLWLPSIGGSTAFPPSGGGPSINVTAEKIIDSLKMAFMGTLEGRKGQWGFLTDVAYVNLGQSKSATREFGLGPGNNLPVGLDANIRLDVKNLAWTLAATHAVVATPESSFDLLAGARMLDYKQTLEYQLNGTVAAGTPLPARSGTSEAKLNNWDAVIGLKGRVNFGDDRKWFIPYYLDVGAGESKSTWQAVAGLGYQYQWGALSATWRYVEYKFKSPSPVESVNFNGPAIVASFQW